MVETFPHQDPYRYPIPLLREIAFQAGFRLDIVDDYGHPTQTMGRFVSPGFGSGFVDMRIGLLATVRDDTFFATFLQAS